LLIPTCSPGFHLIPLGVSGGRREGGKMEMEKRERLWKMNHILFALLNPSVAVIQYLIYISVLKLY
jgi:hypothetical protein